MSAPTDEQLLAQHLQGDAQAFRTLVERHYRELFQFVFRFTRSAAVADDVVQDAFLQIHLAGQNFDPERRLKPWLFTIAANKARDQLRGRGRRREVPLDAQIDGDTDGQTFLDLLGDETESPTAQLEADEQRLLVRQVIEHMPENLAEVLILAYYHHLPYRDIAETLGVPVGTVKSRLHAAVGHFGKRYRALAGAESKEDAQ